MLITWFHRHTNQCSISFTKCGIFFFCFRIYYNSKWIKSIVIKAVQNATQVHALLSTNRFHWTIAICMSIYPAVEHSVEKKTKKIKLLCTFFNGTLRSAKNFIVRWYVFVIHMFVLLYSVAFYNCHLTERPHVPNIQCDAICVKNNAICSMQKLCTVLKCLFAFQKQS